MATDRVEIRPATVEHAIDLAPRVRISDGRCAKEVFGCSVEESLVAGVKDGYARGGWDGDFLIALWGLRITSLIAGEGYPWLIASPEFRQYRRSFLRIYPGELLRMRAITPRLLTLVDPACAEAVQWARRAGFDLIETVYGMRRTHVFMAVMGG